MTSWRLADGGAPSNEPGLPPTRYPSGTADSFDPGRRSARRLPRNAPGTPGNRLPGPVAERAVRPSGASGAPYGCSVATENGLDATPFHPSVDRTS